MQERVPDRVALPGRPLGQAGEPAGRIALLILALIPAGAGLGFALPSVIVVLLETIPAEQAGMGAGLLNSSRQVGGTLAVAVFGAMIAHRASFVAGMRASVLIAVLVLVAATAAALSLPRSVPGPAGPAVPAGSLAGSLAGK
jgi:sugar phosphate permease